MVSGEHQRKEPDMTTKEPDMTTTTTAEARPRLFTGRDILAAENSLRCARDLAAAVALVGEMPAVVVTRLARHVQSPSENPREVAVHARACTRGRGVR